MSSRFTIPGDDGVGYSLMPMKAPNRVCVGVRYSTASGPNSSREVASTSDTGAPGSGHDCRSPLTSSPRNASSAERGRPSGDSRPSTSGSYAARPASTCARSFAHASSDSRISASALVLSARWNSRSAAAPTAVGCGR